MSHNKMYSLTKPQKLIYDTEKYVGKSVSNICGCLMIKGHKDTSVMVSAIKEIYRLNDAFRIRIFNLDGKIFQRVEEYTEKNIDVLEFKDQVELDLYAESYAKEPIDLYGDLVELRAVITEDSYGLLIKIHHIISDAWSISLIGTQFCSILRDEIPYSGSYIDYIDVEGEYLKSKRHEKDKEYYIEQFQKCNEVLYLCDKESYLYESARKHCVIDKKRTKLIANYALEHKTSVYTMLMTAFAVYFSRIKQNNEKFYIGTAMLNRSDNKQKNTLGMFINTTPVLMELNNELAFSDNMAGVSKKLFGAIKHQRFNYNDIIKALNKEYDFSGRLYDVMLSYQNARFTGVGTEYDSVWYSNGYQSESLQIHIDDRDSDGIFTVNYDYRTDLLSEKDIERMHENIFNILFDGMATDKKIKELNILSEKERYTLLYGFNNTLTDYPKEKCIHELFDEEAVKNPQKTAIIACDATLTYGELNTLSNRIANGLIKSGVTPGDIVAFSMPRISTTVAVMFGILKAGAAYMPVDPAYPKDRIDYMLSDSNAVYLINEDNVCDFITDKADNPSVKVKSDDCCYCIYTSGSTGKPKGTLICHYNVVNYTNKNIYNFVNGIIKDEYNNILSVTTIGFDIFVTESIMTLVSGKTMLFANEHQCNSQKELNEFSLKYGAEVLQTTPTKMQMLISDNTYAQYLKNLKVVMLGGESVLYELCEKLKAMTDAEIFNVYGPTETTVWSTFSKVTGNDITIGKPIANTQIYIVDKFNNLMPIGHIGELCIAGDGVGAGYLNRSELTYEKFIDNPFGSGKLYKTGDLAYWKEDGNIVYVGRNDFQVKIRGLRIELGEIENVINSVEGVSQAVVTVRKDTNNRQLICAFFTENKKTEISYIKKVMSSKLPKYMIPHIFTAIDKMPLTSSGKINRNALPSVDLLNICVETEYVKPQTEIQQKISEIMESVLNYSPVGLSDDFFDLGGDSLKAIEFVSKAHSEGIYFNLQAVYDNPTVEKLCSCIENKNKEHISYNYHDFEKYGKILKHNAKKDIIIPNKMPLGNVFITGSTGFLGSHIIDKLILLGAKKIYCFVRDDVVRLYKTLEFYFGSKYKGDKRIIPVIGDLDQLADIKIHDDIDFVVHAAASVKHYGAYEYFYNVNVTGTKNALDFAKKHNSKFIHISTLSVSGNSLADNFDVYKSEEEKEFYENTLYVGQPLDNVYIRSKFEAEKAVLDAALDGLKVNIVRVGNLTNRISDAKFQKNYQTNAFLKRVKAVLELGCFPDYLMHLYGEFSPVDSTAEAIVKIMSHFNQRHTIFNVNSHKVLYFDKMFEFLRGLNIDINVVTGIEFLQKLKLSKFKYAYKTLINDMDDNGKLIYDSNIRIHNEFTVKYLENLGFEWPDSNFDYIKNYIEYFRNINYLKV